MSSVIPDTPYTAALEGHEPIASMREVVSRIAELATGWTPHEFERSHAPGRWPARIILLHLAHSELAFGTRARMALSTSGYTAQPFNQDEWVKLEDRTSGDDALRAFIGLGALNIALYAGLSDAAREKPLSHPEYGSMTVNWIIYQQAGHQRHHLKQLEIIAGT